MNNMKRNICIGSMLIVLLCVAACGGSHDKPASINEITLPKSLPQSQSELDTVLNNMQLKSPLSDKDIGLLSYFLCQLSAYEVGLNKPSLVVKFDSPFFRALDTYFYDKLSWQMIRLQAKNRQGIEVFVLAAYTQQACENIFGKTKRID